MLKLTWKSQRIKSSQDYAEEKGHGGDLPYQEQVIVTEMAYLPPLTINTAVTGHQ